ncbi:MAG: hypothetical protein NUV32_05070 [Exilispira sp.]|jgi:hypothetical protein|nr:hypothetical protein [Exilispira sp.]
MNTKIKKIFICCILLLFFIILLSCSVNSYFIIDSDFNFYCSKIQVFSSYNEYAELGAKQFLALLGLDDDFIISQGMQDIFSMEQILEVTPVNGLYKIDLSTNNEITLNDSFFMWKIHNRNSIFPANKKEEIIMKIIIRIDPPVMNANTYDVKGNLYSWSFSFGMLQNGVQIVVYFKK